MWCCWALLSFMQICAGKTVQQVLSSPQSSYHHPKTGSTSLPYWPGSPQSLVLHYIYHFNNIFLLIKITCDRFPSWSISAIHVRCLAHIFWLTTHIRIGLNKTRYETPYNVHLNFTFSSPLDTRSFTSIFVFPLIIIDQVLSSCQTTDKILAN